MRSGRGLDAPVGCPPWSSARPASAPFWSGLLLLAAAACAPAEPLSDTEVLDAAAGAVADRLDAPEPVALHPYLALGRTDGSTDLAHGGFNTFDAGSIRRVVDAGGGRWRVCATSAAGACDPEGGVALVLSEPTRLGEDLVGVGVYVTDGRADRPRTRSLGVRMDRRTGARRVIERG